MYRSTILMDIHRNTDTQFVIIRNIIAFKTIASEIVIAAVDTHTLIEIVYIVISNLLI